MLIGGAGGGQAGFDGAAGEAPSGLKNYEAVAQGMGGAGGNGGACGERPNVLSFQVVSLPSYYDGCAIGAGGAGGASNGALGSAGGATTLGGFTSADGSQPLDDVVNFLDGTVYASLNEAGESGANGGIGSGRGSYDGRQDTSTNGSNHICEDGVTIYYGGSYSNGSSYSYSHTTYATGGAGGGGAAHGANGSNGVSASYEQPSLPYGAQGGDGASATAPAQATETQAGRGGHGGGGGGGAAQCYLHTDGSSVFSYGFNYGGAGGLGSAGGQGGDGLIVIYYNA